MAKKWLFLRAALWLVLLSGVMTASAQSWPKDYKEKSADEFRRDSRARGLIREKIHAPFDKDLWDALSGPPGPVNWTVGRYFATSACLYRFCPIKGFFWLDTRTGTALGGVLTTELPDYKVGGLRLDSRNIAGDLPSAARRAVLEWLMNVGVEVRDVSFTDDSDNLKTMDAELFQWRSRGDGE